MKTVLGCILLHFALLISYSSGQNEGLTSQLLEKSVERVESVREIKNLQRQFAQFAQFGRWEEIAALFSELGILQWGDRTTTGQPEIAARLRSDAGTMDGMQFGSLHTSIFESPVISLSMDGRRAKGRWNALRLMGDGKGGTKIDGGVYENEYVYNAEEGKWGISLLRLFPQFKGTYEEGWQNVGTGTRSLGIVSYHFTPDSVSEPIIANISMDTKSSGDITRKGSGHYVVKPTTPSLESLAWRITRLNEEDKVRNLQHAYGYYVDRRMWTDVVDLFAPNATVTIHGRSYVGVGGVRQAMEETMGPENLTEGILNDHPMFSTIVNISPDGMTAVARGIEVAMIGRALDRTATWEFNTFYNTFTKDSASSGWKIQKLNITSLIIANYSTGWGLGGVSPTASTAIPPFLNIFYPSSPPVTFSTSDPKPLPSIAELHRRLLRSAAYDSIDSLSSAYGIYADDIRCENFARLHAAKGHKLSPGKGWFHTPHRIAGTCLAGYKVSASYDVTDPNPQRPRIPFHWRPQSVIIVSEDGRSATLRARLVQFGTGNATSSGFPGVQGFNGGMYHDQFVLEETGDGTQSWKIWSLTIDEFYWQSSSWAAGWANVSRAESRSKTIKNRKVRDDVVGGTKREEDVTERRSRDEDFNTPDLSLKDPGLESRENGLPGGPTEEIKWPRIIPMWFSYRNPVSGREPPFYWPGCVPCRAKPEWSLERNGFMEPSTGPPVT